MTGQPPENRPRQGMDYGETQVVRDTHAAIVREKVEPRVGREPLSLWLIAIYGLAVFFGGAYLGRYAGNFTGDGLDYLGGAPRVATRGAANAVAEQPAELTPAEKGAKIFSANCATCHQANGLGVPGQYPPLAGSDIVNGGSRRHVMIVLKGLQGPLTVKGQHFGSAVMQPWEKTLTNEKIADVVTYERSSWGNKGAPVTAEGVEALRKELAGRTESYTEPDILAVPADANVPGATPPAGPAPGVSASPGGSPPAPAPKS
ncbi:MAG: c-type cytochrome [Chthoniobacterales bacterium]